MPAPQRTARIEDEIWNPAQARAKTEGASLGALMRDAIQRYATGDLTSHADAASQPASQRAAAAITVTGDGDPSPGVVCMGPGCFQRDTSKYGLRQVPFCPACRAALEGRTHQRQIPPGAARIMRRGAA